MSRGKFIIRLALAATLLIAAGDIFFRFLERPEPSFEAQNFLISLTAAGYIWPTIGLVFLAAAILLCFRRTIGLGLVITGPVMLNIVLYHLVLDPAILTAGRDMLLVILHLGTSILHWRNFRSLVTPVADE